MGLSHRETTFHGGIFQTRECQESYENGLLTIRAEHEASMADIESAVALELSREEIETDASTADQLVSLDSDFGLMFITF